MTTFRREMRGLVPEDLVITAIIPKDRTDEFVPGTAVRFINQEMVEVAGELPCHGHIACHEKYTANNGYPLVGVRLIDRTTTLAYIQNLHHFNEEPKAPVCPPELESYWLHSNGSVYLVYDITNETSTRLDEYPINVSYERLNDGTTWSKDVRGFLRSRTPISKEEAEARLNGEM